MAQKPHLGILPVTLDLLQDLFQLPEGYTIVGCNYKPADRTIDFTLASYALPEAQEYFGDLEVPHLALQVTVETLPDQSPDYRKITTKAEAL